MTEPQIKNLKDLINQIDENKKYIDSKICNFTAAGDNYGSLMLGVTISLKNRQGQVESVEAVAKMFPQSEFIQAMFNSKLTFRNEVGFYRTIAPTLRDFQKEQGFTELFDAFPGFYGARLSLNPQKTEADKDAVLLINNLKNEDFENVDRTVGFDYEQTKIILEKMAELHATFLAFKLHKPEVFEEKLGEFFEEFTCFDGGDSGESSRKMCDAIVDSVKDDEFCVEYLDRVQKVLVDCVSNVFPKNAKNILQGPFSSFIHCDMWINNIMVKIVNGKTVDVKFVDFQIYENSSLARDVVFFLFTSVQLPVIQKSCDDFLKFYYNTFLNYLKRLNCDLSPYSYEGFIDEMKKCVLAFEFFHIMLMLAPIYATKSEVLEIDNIMDSDDLVNQRKTASSIVKKKAAFIVKEFINRDWI